MTMVDSPAPTPLDIHNAENQRRIARHLFEKHGSQPAAEDVGGMERLMVLVADAIYDLEGRRPEFTKRFYDPETHEQGPVR